MDEQWTEYRRSQRAQMRPYVFGEDLTGVSISPEDIKAGSPTMGDMIARNPANPKDRWLVNAAYFKANFESD